MKVTPFTKRALAIRRENRQLTAAGYRKHETDWELHRGFAIGEKIIDARISVDGTHVWTKISGRSPTVNE